MLVRDSATRQGASSAVIIMLIHMIIMLAHIIIMLTHMQS